MYTAIILAAGFSRRMGRFKPLLHLQGRTVLARCVRTFQRAGVEDLIVVLGHRRQEVAAECERLSVPWVHNPEYAQGMYSSVCRGVATLPREAEAFFLLPVDIPLIRPWTLQAVRKAFLKEQPLVAYPCFQGKRGHPPLLSAGLTDEILHFSGEGGLRRLLQDYESRALDVQTFDRNTLLDMDRPEDFAQAEQRWTRMGCLDREEAWALIQRVYPISEQGLAHGRAVAETAESLALSLNEAGCAVDTDLAYACGLVHDMAKGQPRHEAAGGRLLASLGLTDMSPIVAAHRDLELSMQARITAKEVVYLADKITRGPDRVRVQERFQEKLDLYSHDPEAVTAISRRLANARRVQERMERILGRPLQEVVPEISALPTANLK